MRGTFRPPLEAVECWHYVNTDASTEPDYLACAEHIPIPDGSYDMVVLSEVLEHLVEPEKALAVAFRLLAPGDALVCAAPFLYPLHPDPDDYQRWLPAKYKKVLGDMGFQSITVTPMGGFFAVSYDLLHLASRARLRTAACCWKRTAMQCCREGTACFVQAGAAPQDIFMPKLYNGLLCFCAENLRPTERGVSAGA